MGARTEARRGRQSKSPSEAQTATLTRRPLAMAALVILLAYVAVGLLDSLHFHERLPDRQQYSPEVVSVLDKFVVTLRTRVERTYSAPFATHAYSKETVEHVDGRRTREYPRLKYGGAHLDDTDRHGADIAWRVVTASLIGLVIWCGVVAAGRAETAPDQPSFSHGGRC